MYSTNKIISLIGAFAFVTLSPIARAVDPPPDGGYPNANTAEGEDALFSLTAGNFNTAIGFNALHANTTGSANTANGGYTLISNTTGSFNTATGEGALASNTVGENNTANGLSALQNNTSGFANTASGWFALYSNTTGNNNTANGGYALFSNTTGSFNTASGFGALGSNTTGTYNMASGFGALAYNTTGSKNLANGLNALYNNTTGNNNIAEGVRAGENLTTGNNNIDIGNPGIPRESGHIRIGRVGIQDNVYIAGISGVTIPGGVGVIVDSDGHLGTIVSSALFKDAIRPMDKTSEAILALRPVTFHYKKELDPKGIPQFGLVAEQVEKVNPDLVARDANGKPYTVRYEAVNAMLLNEFLKEHCKVEEQEATITRLKTTVAKLEAVSAEQQSKIEGFTAALKEQAAQIQKVSNEIELIKPAPRTVADNH